MILLAAAEQIGDIPALHQPAGVGEIHHSVAERDGVLDRDIVVPRVGQQLLVVARDRRHDLRIDGDLSVRVVASVQLHHVEPTVLPALQEVVAQDERSSVPVVVPERARDGAVGVHRPEHGGARTIHRDDAEQVVARARVVQGIPLRIRCRRTLREIARDQVGPDRPSRAAVQEVVVAVVRAFTDLDAAVLVHDHVRLSGPPRPAPHTRPGLIRRRGAESAALRVVPADHRVPRDRSFTVVVPRGVPPERRDPGERRVDRTGGRNACRGRGRCRRFGRAARGGRTGGWRGRCVGFPARLPGSEPHICHAVTAPASTSRPSKTTGNGTLERAACRGERRAMPAILGGGGRSGAQPGYAAARYVPRTRSIDV